LTLVHTVQSELWEAKFGTELGFQLSEGGDVAGDTSTVSVGPVVKRDELTIVGGTDGVGGEGRHWCDVVCCGVVRERLCRLVFE